MNAQELQELLVKLGACREAVEWCDGQSLREAWRQAKRADWMLWLLARMNVSPGWPSHQTVVLLACDCALTAKKYWRKQDKAPCLKAIRTARKWARGEATLQEVRSAADAAYAAAVVAAAAAAAAYAAYAASSASAAAAAAAASAAAYAASADDAKLLAHKNMCALIRKRVPYPIRGRE